MGIRLKWGLRIFLALRSGGAQKSKKKEESGEERVTMKSEESGHWEDLRVLLPLLPFAWFVHHYYCKFISTRERSTNIC